MGVKDLIQRPETSWRAMIIFYSCYLACWQAPGIRGWSFLAWMQTKCTGHSLYLCVFSEGWGAVPFHASCMYLLPGQQRTSRTFRAPCKSSLILTFHHLFFSLIAFPDFCAQSGMRKHLFYCISDFYLCVFSTDLLFLFFPSVSFIYCLLTLFIFSSKISFHSFTWLSRPSL